MKKQLFLILTIFSTIIYSQENCFIYPEGSNERKACDLVYEALEYKQGSRKSQILFDSILNLNPKYAWVYAQKSVPYFKRGFIIRGLKLLDKAVDLDPKSHLSYRAYWHFQNRNYKLCIRDLETYYALPNAYIYEMSPGGDKDMRIILGMSYAKLGNLKKGISVIETCIESYKNQDYIGFVDYHILGMLYYKNKEYDKALKVLKTQITVTEDYADTYYYLGLTYKALSQFKKAKTQFKKAILKFQEANRMRNGYLCFRVYLSDAIYELDSSMN
tara:strand:- start:156 stop:974 length:819 start_codon:yes stop_codon:yes gene_type:complete